MSARHLVATTPGEVLAPAGGGDAGGGFGAVSVIEARIEA